MFLRALRERARINLLMMSQMASEERVLRRKPLFNVLQAFLRVRFRRLRIRVKGQGLGQGNILRSFLRLERVDLHLIPL